MLTVAVCTYRRFDRLPLCLESLRQQSVPQDQYELLIIDNSLQPEESIAFRGSLSGFKNIRYVITEQCGIAFARNEALKLCETDILVFTDDDCIVPRNWVENYFRAFSRWPQTVAAIGGKVKPQWESEPPTWLQGKLRHSLALIDWGDEEIFVDHSSSWLLTANAGYRTPALRRAGGFPEHLGRKRKLPLAQEEFAANQALRCLGYDLIYAPSLEVSHFIPSARVTQRNLCGDAFWDGVSQALYRRRGLSGKDTDALSESLFEKVSNLLDGDDAAYETLELEERRKQLRVEGFKEADRLLQERESFDPQLGSFWPVIYITTPCLNAVDSLDQTIASVVTQAGDFSIRYHVQDGGSKDGTLELLSRWQARLSDGQFPVACRNVVFSYASGSDRGMYDALVKSYETMSIPPSAFMSWLNADDVLMPGALAFIQVVANQLRPEYVSWISGSTTQIKNNITVLQVNHPTPTEAIKRGLCDGSHWHFVQQEGTFFRKWLWDKAGGPAALRKYKLAGDWNLWRYFAHHAHLVQHLFPLAAFRVREGQLSQTGMLAYQEEINNTIAYDERTAELQHIVDATVLKHRVIKLADPQSGAFALLDKRAQGQGHYYYEKAFGRWPDVALSDEDDGEQVIHDPSRETTPPQDKAAGSADPGSSSAAARSRPEAGAPVRSDAITPEAFRDFTFSRRSHWNSFDGLDVELYGKKVDPDAVHLKYYQDLLTLAFIKANVPPGGRILEVGGGQSRVLEHLSRTHECWNIDKLEGVGNGPRSIESGAARLIRDYIGNFNSELPENYFDIVFSISVLEHVPQDDQSLCERIVGDITRVLKPGGFSLHVCDVIFKEQSFWCNKVVLDLFARVDAINHFVAPDEVKGDADLYCMTEAAYRQTWQRNTGKSYSEHGRPSSLNLLWRKNSVSRQGAGPSVAMAAQSDDRTVQSVSRGTRPGTGDDPSSARAEPSAVHVEERSPRNGEPADLNLLQLYRVQEELDQFVRLKRRQDRTVAELKAQVAQLGAANRDKDRSIRELSKHWNSLSLGALLKLRLSGIAKPVQDFLAPWMRARNWLRLVNGRERALMVEAGIIRSSGLFDEGWYLERYPDVAKAGRDPVEHYLRYGFAEGRNPSPLFDTRWYLNTYPDVYEAGVNPLLHYIQYGKRERRQTVRAAA